MKSIFKKIIDKELPSNILFENENILAIEDKFPIAPYHILIMPKKEIQNIQSLKKEDFFLLEEIFKVAQNLAKKFNISDGYRLLTNNGENAGQTISHLHFHLIAGKRLGKMG